MFVYINSIASICIVPYIASDGVKYLQLTECEQNNVRMSWKYDILRDLWIQVLDDIEGRLYLPLKLNALLLPLGNILIHVLVYMCACIYMQQYRLWVTSTNNPVAYLWFSQQCISYQKILFQKIFLFTCLIIKIDVHLAPVNCVPDKNHDFACWFTRQVNDMRKRVMSFQTEESQTRLLLLLLYGTLN